MLLSLLQLPLILSLLVLFFYPSLRYSVRRYRSNNNNNTKLPPGSFGWLPFLGHTLAFVLPHLSSSRGQFLQQNIEKYGNIFSSHLFGHPTVVSCDAEFNNFILQNEDRLFEAGYPINIPGVLGDITMLVITGDVHKRIRGVALNLFASVKAQNSSFLADIEDNVLRVMKSWKDKETLVFCSETRKFTFGVIVKQILSLNAEDPVTIEILKNFNTFMKGLVSMPINLPGTPYNKAIKAKFRIKEIVSRIRRQREKGREREKNGRMDFLDILLTQKDINNNINVSEDEISSLVLDLLLGGYETTAMLIAIIVRFLGEKHNSAILDQLREEHLSLIPPSKNGNKSLEWDDYKKMEFTQCLINEALRLGNVVKFVHRKAIKPIHYKDFDIPVGWRVLPIFTGVHLDNSLHPDPFNFDPRRWQGVDAASAWKKFMPFGGGKRLCPGSEVARWETSLFLHHLVLNYSWLPLIDSDLPISHPYLDFKYGLPLSIRPLPPPATSAGGIQTSGSQDR